MAGGIIYLAEKLINLFKGVALMLFEIIAEKYKEHRYEVGMKDGIAVGMKEGIAMGKEEGIAVGNGGRATGLAGVVRTSAGGPPRRRTLQRTTPRLLPG